VALHQLRDGCRDRRDVACVEDDPSCCVAGGDHCRCAFCAQPLDDRLADQSGATHDERDAILKSEVHESAQ
jgi:hypothetical protein